MLGEAAPELLWRPEPKPKDTTPVNVEVFWLAASRVWVVRLIDAYGNQVGDAQFAANKQAAQALAAGTLN